MSIELVERKSLLYQSWDEGNRLNLLLNYQKCRGLSGSDHLVCSGCPSLPAIGQQLPSGSVREFDLFGASVLLFTMRFHIGIDARVG